MDPLDGQEIPGWTKKIWHLALYLKNSVEEEKKETLGSLMISCRQSPFVRHGGGDEAISLTKTKASKVASRSEHTAVVEGSI